MESSGKNAGTAIWERISVTMFLELHRMQLAHHYIKIYFLKRDIVVLASLQEKYECSYAAIKYSKRL